MRKVFLIIFSALFFLIFTKNVKAEGEFKTDIDVTYKISEDGTTTVTHGVRLTNLFSNLYATSYSLILGNINPINPRAFQGDESLGVESTKKEDTTILKVSFPDNLVGKDKARNFKIEFEESEVASKTGEVWEISVPKISSLDSFNSYYLNLVVPKSLGTLAYLSPDADNSYESNGNYVYSFDRERVAKAGITAGFGEFQVFNFTLNYHLENPLPRTSETEIAIPPDTSLQKMYYTGISPAPKNIIKDQDENWLAVYSLKPRERIDVVVNGAVQIFSTTRPFNKPTQEELATDLMEREFWEISDPQIISVAKNLKTPRQVYDYVVSTLNYNYDRVKPNTVRAGAKSALMNPNSAICMEFTDLFVALSRAAGIPAREVNGYAYTENPEIQPLSLVADVLHAWPEYWDSEIGAWVAVDPTWGSTTGGIDFFNKLDLRHFTFVVHGADSQKPFPPGSYKLGANPQKDVFVNFGRLPEKRSSDPEINIEAKKTLPFFPQKFLITVKNPGPTSQNDVDVNIFFDNKKQQTFNVETLIPFTAQEYIVSVPFSFLGSSTPHDISVSVLGVVVKAPTAKNLVVIYSLIIFSFFLVALIIFLLIRLKGVQIQAFLDRLKLKVLKPYVKIANKFKKDQQDTEQS